MPEGDTIYRAAANLGRALTGKTIVRFETVYPQLARVHDDEPLTGRTVERVWAEGKHLLMRFSGGQTLRTHMRMNGSWHIYKPGDRWQRPRSDLRILLEATSPPPLAPEDPGAPSALGRSPDAAPETYLAIAFNVPVAELLDDRALERSPTLARLGPDLLGETFDLGDARRRARAKPTQPASEILLDQSVAAGAGNVYRSEVLFLTRTNPDEPTSELADIALDQLFTIARKLMRANIATGRENGMGGTAGIVTYTGLRRTTHRSDPGERLWVYGRSGKPCRRCGTLIEYRKVGPDARGLYYCPKCQGARG